MNILVTGCSRGVGLEICRVLLEEGHVVYGVFVVIRMNSEYLKKNMKVNSFLKVLISQIRPIFTRLFLKSFLLTQSY